MKVTLSCVGGSAEYFPSGTAKMEAEAEPGDTIEDVLVRLRVSKDLFMFAQVNGVKADLSNRVREGDDIVLVSPLAGG